MRPRFRRSDACLEPLPFAIDQADESDRRVEKARGKPRQPVEILVGDRHVRHGSLKDTEPLRRVEHLRYRWKHRLCLFTHPA